jgi:hypothetical protein
MLSAFFMWIRYRKEIVVDVATSLAFGPMRRGKDVLSHYTNNVRIDCDIQRIKFLAC